MGVISPFVLARDVEVTFALHVMINIRSSSLFYCRSTPTERRLLIHPYKKENSAAPSSLFHRSSSSRFTSNVAIYTTAEDVAARVSRLHHKMEEVCGPHFSSITIKHNIISHFRIIDTPFSPKIYHRHFKSTYQNTTAKGRGGKRTSAYGSRERERENRGI